MKGKPGRKKEKVERKTDATYRERDERKDDDDDGGESRVDSHLIQLISVC